VALLAGRRRLRIQFRGHLLVKRRQASSAIGLRKETKVTKTPSASFQRRPRGDDIPPPLP
jgi:hypothetical protein